MIKIAIISTDSSLVNNLVFKYKLSKKEENVYTKYYNERLIVVGKANFDRISLTSFVQNIIDTYEVDLIINANLSIKVSDKVDFLDLTVSKNYFDNIYDDELSVDETLLKLALKEFDLMNLEYHIVSSKTIDYKLKNKDFLENIDILDYESHTILKVASLNKISSISFSIIKDEDSDLLEDAIDKLSDYIVNYADTLFNYYEDNIGDSIYLKIPEYEDLDFYKEILMDPNTMNYNKGYDINIEGYDYETGCINYFDKEKWYKKIMRDKNRFFAYVILRKINIPIGYVMFHFDEKTLNHRVGLVISYKYRNKGYGTLALKKLNDIAFNQYKIEVLSCTIPYSLDYAIKLARKNGFVDMNEDFYIKRFDRKERFITLALSKTKYKDT